MQKLITSIAGGGSQLTYCAIQPVSRLERQGTALQDSEEAKS